jgi:hypothetical protein
MVRSGDTPRLFLIAMNVDERQRRAAAAAYVLRGASLSGEYVIAMTPPATRVLSAPICRSSDSLCLNDVLLTNRFFFYHLYSWHING